MSDSDDRLMGLAIALGRRELGRTWPNPSVGAVLVDPVGNSILAQGVTQPGGRPHAEVAALAAAGETARGATLYVSLEPCSHHGRTPPCADAIVAAGIGRVVSALEDPNPVVAGRGHARLRAAGIVVRTGVRDGEARVAHRGHVTLVSGGRPFVTLKLARTADGCASRSAPERLIITGEAAAARMHMLRARADAVMVGIGTALADDPRLDVRLPGLQGRSPLRIVLDSRLRLPLASRLVQGAGAHRTWLVTTGTALAAGPDHAGRLAAAGIEVVATGADETGRIDLGAALAEFGRRGLTTILSEGGPTLADALAENDLVDEAVILTSPRRLDAPGLPAIGPSLRRTLDERMVAVDRDMLGPDMMDVWQRRAACSQVS